jgi:TolA-binding protein
MLYSRGMHLELELASKNIINRIDSGKIGYEATSGIYASFYLGQVYGNRGDLMKAKTYYQKAVDYSEQTEATESGYYLYSLIELGEINVKQGNNKEAKKYFNEVKKKSGRKQEAYKDAKKRLKNLEKARE